MSNGGPNTGTPESPEAMPPKKERSINATGLLKVAIERELGAPVDPRKYDAFIAKNDSVVNNIRGNIDDLRGFSDEDWSGISDEDITKIKNEALIRESMLKSCQDLVINRKKLTDRALSRFPGIVKIPDWQGKFDDAIAGIDETVLYNTFLHAPRMKQLVHGTFPDFHDDGIERNFEKIFADIGTVGNATNEALVKKIHREYERFGVPPSKEKIAYLLDIYKGTSAKRKKEVLSAIGATISIGYAIENGVISDQYLEGFARTNFGELYEKLTPDQKRFFKSNLKSKKELTVRIDELDDAHLDKIFEPKVIKQLSEEITADLTVNKKEVNIPTGGVMEKIKEELEKQGKTDWDIHTEFLRYVERNVRTQDRSKCSIENISNLKNGSVMVFGEGENAKYLRLSAITGDDGLPLDVYNGAEAGVRIEGLPVQNGTITGSERSELSYDHFYDLLSKGGSTRVLSREEFQAKLTNESSEAGKDGKLYDASELEGTEATGANIKDKINGIDSANSIHGFEPGTFFIAPGTEEDGKTDDEIWKVEKIHGDSIDLMNSVGHIDKNLPISGVFKVLKGTRSFKRIGKMGSDDDFLRGLTEYGIPAEAKLDGGKLIYEKEDGHGHKKKETLVTLYGKEGHVRIGDISGGLVYFSNGKESSTKEEIQEFAGKHGNQATLKKYYEEPQKMTYQAFLEYLKDNKITKSEGDYLEYSGTDAHGDHTHEHSHIHGDFWSRLGKMQNFSSIWKGFEMITHSIEHTLEKGSKLDAAKFALSTSKFLHLPDSIEAQLYADIVDGSKEIVEKYQKKIKNLPGPKQRDKCIHIAHNKDARPEEVMAAIGFMVSSYGHLYAEDNRHYQSVVTRKGLETRIDGAYSFLDAFIRSTRMPARDGKKAHVFWRLKAYDKARQEAGSEGEPTEEQLLHALFKTIDGNPEDFPYAASVVKAIGGPGGFEKMWKFEGFDNAHKKGMDQTKMVNSQGQLNKAIGYLDTHELYKGVGAMEQVAAKVKSPQFQAFPFVWAVGGFTKYASSQAIQKLKNYAENGFSFHAYAFLRKEDDNNTYRETVRIALKELEKQRKVDVGTLDEFDSICSRFDYTGEKRDSKDKPAEAMMNFWQKYQSKGLHDMLQNTNGWLTKVSSENEATKKYKDTLSGAHDMLLKDGGIPGTDFGKDWYEEHGYQNMIMRTNKDTGLKSLDSMLNKIRFETTNRGGKPMNDEHKEKIWNYVVDYMKEGKGLRDTNMFLGDEDLQKKQYLAHRAEIIVYLSKMTSAGEVKDLSDRDRLINGPEYSYYKDLKDMGIDPYSVFDYKLSEQNAEGDYQRWKNGVRYGEGGMGVSSVLDQIRGKVSGGTSTSTSHE